MIKSQQYRISHVSARRTVTRKPIHRIKDTEALRIVTQMMAIPGPSGEEAAVMEFIRGKLTAAGVATRFLVDDGANRRSPIGGQCGNLVLRMPGTMRAPRRMRLRPRA